MGNIVPRWAKIASRCGNIGATQSQKERREREREAAGHVQDGSPDLGVYQDVYARAVSPLLEKDATGTPEVPAPVVYEGGEAMLSHDLVADTETETDRYRDGDRDALHIPT